MANHPFIMANHQWIIMDLNHATNHYQPLDQPLLVCGFNHFWNFP